MELNQKFHQTRSELYSSLTKILINKSLAVNIQQKYGVEYGSLTNYHEAAATVGCKAGHTIRDKFKDLESRQSD